MISPDYAQTLARYSARMNEKVFAAAVELSPEVRKQDHGAFFRSVQGTLNHILWADGIWMARFQGLPRPEGSYAHELASDFDELRALRRAMDARIQSWTETLTADWLEADFTWQSGGSGAQVRPAWVLVTHLFNHATHHRGQLSTLLTQLGIDVGTTDLPWVIVE